MILGRGADSYERGTIVNRFRWRDVFRRRCPVPEIARVRKTKGAQSVWVFSVPKLTNWYQKASVSTYEWSTNPGKSHRVFQILVYLTRLECVSHEFECVQGGNMWRDLISTRHVVCSPTKRRDFIRNYYSPCQKKQFHRQLLPKGAISSAIATQSYQKARFHKQLPWSCHH